MTRDSVKLGKLGQERLRLQKNFRFEELLPKLAAGNADVDTNRVIGRLRKTVLLRASTEAFP